MSNLLFDLIGHSGILKDVNLSLSLSLSQSRCQFCCCADIVLKDKIVVYDLENQRIGWVDYDCKFPIM